MEVNRVVNGCYIRIEIPDGELKAIMDEINKAQETIYKCYNRLQDLGVIIIKEQAASSN